MDVKFHRLTKQMTATSRNRLALTLKITSSLYIIPFATGSARLAEDSLVTLADEEAVVGVRITNVYLPCWKALQSFLT